MVDINPTISTITLNVIGLNAPIKRQILSRQMKKHDSTMCCLQETHFKYKGHIQIKSKWRKIYYADINQKKAGIAILISDRANFKIRALSEIKNGNT